MIYLHHTPAHTKLLFPQSSPLSKWQFYSSSFQAQNLGVILQAHYLGLSSCYIFYLLCLPSRQVCRQLTHYLQAFTQKQLLSQGGIFLTTLLEMTAPLPPPCHPLVPFSFLFYFYGLLIFLNFFTYLSVDCLPSPAYNSARRSIFVLFTLVSPGSRHCLACGRCSINIC